LAAGLAPGSFLSDEEIAEFVRQDDLHRVYDAALVLLSYRPRSVAELRNRLRRRGFEASLVEDSLERLQQQGLLDDAGFAQFWVDNRQTHRPRGGRLLYAELRSKGIDREIIDDVLPKAEEEDDAAYRVGRRRLNSLKGLEWREFRRRMGDYLVRRGFGYETADAAVRRLWNEEHGVATEGSGEGFDAEGGV